MSNYFIGILGDTPCESFEDLVIKQSEFKAKMCKQAAEVIKMVPSPKHLDTKHSSLKLSAHNMDIIMEDMKEDSSIIRVSEKMENNEKSIP